MPIGVTLSQPKGNKDHLVAFVIQKLSKAKYNYTMMEREALAMVYPLHKFMHYLLSIPFTYYIGHEPLKFLLNKLVI